MKLWRVTGIEVTRVEGSDEPSNGNDVDVTVVAADPWNNGAMDAINYVKQCRVGKVYKYDDEEIEGEPVPSETVIDVMLFSVNEVADVNAIAAPSHSS